MTRSRSFRTSLNTLIERIGRSVRICIEPEFSVTKLSDRQAAAQALYTALSIAFWTAATVLVYVRLDNLHATANHLGSTWLPHDSNFDRIAAVAHVTLPIAGLLACIAAVGKMHRDWRLRRKVRVSEISKQTRYAAIREDDDELRIAKEMTTLERMLDNGCMFLYDGNHDLCCGNTANSPWTPSVLAADGYVVMIDYTLNPPSDDTEQSTNDSEVYHRYTGTLLSVLTIAAMVCAVPVATMAMVCAAHDVTEWFADAYHIAITGSMKLASG